MQTIIITQNGGPYTLMLATWLLHLPVAGIMLTNLKQFVPRPLASIQHEATSWGTDLFTLLSLVSAAILLLAPSRGVQYVESLFVETAPKTAAPIGVLARSCGAVALEWAVFSALHGRMYPNLMLAARAAVVALCGTALLWHWGLLVPRLNMPSSVGALVAALIVAGPSLVSLPASIAESKMLVAHEPKGAPAAFPAPKEAKRG